MLKISTPRLALTAVVALSALQAVPAAAQSDPMLGQIMCAGYNFTPRGWASLDGQLLPISQNSALFSLLGTTYGGDGRTTFALPDMRGRNIVHVGNGPGLTPRQLGERGGTESVTLTTSNLPSHSHNFSPLGSNNDATSVSPAGKVASTKSRTTLYTDPANTVAMAQSQTSAEGGGVAVNNLSPFLTVNCYMALQGIYPSRN
jgi:microcystin-dependent protein